MNILNILTCYPRRLEYVDHYKQTYNTYNRVTESLKIVKSNSRCGSIYKKRIVLREMILTLFLFIIFYKFIFNDISKSY